MSLSPFEFAQLLNWCDTYRDSPRPALCCPRLLCGRMVATDGKALAWRRADPRDVDPLACSAMPSSLTCMIDDIEAGWPSAWRTMPPTHLPIVVREACCECRGTGLGPSTDDDGKQAFGTWYCHTCEGTGHADGPPYPRLDFMPAATALGLDYLLRIGPCDRIAWLPQIGRSGSVIGETPSGMRYGIMPIALVAGAHPTHVIATRPHQGF